MHVLRPYRDKAIDEAARLQQEMIQASRSSSTGGNTQSDMNPQSISVSARKKYALMNPLPDTTSTSPSPGMSLGKWSIQDSTEGEKAKEGERGEGEVENGASMLQTSIQDPDCHQDEVSSQSKRIEPKAYLSSTIITNKHSNFVTTFAYMSM